MRDIRTTNGVTDTTLGGNDDGDDDEGDDEEDDRRFNFNFFKLMVVLLFPVLAEDAGAVLEADKSCSCDGRFLGMLGSAAAEEATGAADSEEALWLLPLPPLLMFPNPAFRGIVPINDDDDAEDDGVGRASLL